MTQSEAKATLSFSDGSPSLEFPIYKGSIGPDVIDIRKLYGSSGKFTYDPGFMSTAACNSSITYIDGDKGELLYRGYPIEQLAVNCDFLETCYLLLNGELPNAADKNKFVDSVVESVVGSDSDCIAAKTERCENVAYEVAVLAKIAKLDCADVGVGWYRWCAGLVLSRLTRHQRSASSRSIGNSSDRQNADAGCHGL